MPKGPKGEFRPRDSFQGGIVSLKIALGLMTESAARKLASTTKTTRKANKPRKAKKVHAAKKAKAPVRKNRRRKS